MKKEKGITLIALVITIVVLLILAGVSIAMLTGENGILTQAQNASRETGRANVIEQAQTDIMGKQAESGIISLNRDILEEIFDQYFEKVPNNLDENTLLQTKSEYGNYQILVSEMYKGTLEKFKKAVDISASDYGAVVNGYNVKGVNAWKILYADDSNIYLIADDYINVKDCPGSKNYKIKLPMYSKEYRLSMDDVIKDYQGSVNITDDKIKKLNNDYFNVKKYESEYKNMKEVAYMLDTNVWNVFAQEDAEYVIGGPTIEMLINAYNEKYNGIDYKVQASNETGYKISSDDSTWEDSVIFEEKNSFFSINSDEKAIGMWVASPSARYDRDIFYVSSNGNIYNTFENRYDNGFRPVVCLKEETQLEKNSEGIYTIVQDF